MKKAIVASLLAIILAILASCGGGNDVYCTANFVQGGVGMLVTNTVGLPNEFNFKVCYNDTHAGSQVSFYGLELESDIATINLAADVRAAHFTDGFYPGQTYTVTFNNNDTWFIVYKDDNLGNLDNTTEIIRGEFR